MTAQQLKNAILQEAIEGRLVPQDPNDEPASILLERIRAEKERLVKEGKLKKKDLEVKPISENEIPFEIPDSWEWCKINDIAVSQLGKTLDRGKQTGKEYPYLCSINVYWDRINLDKVKTFLLKPEELDRYRLRKGDLLVCEGGEYGRCNIWDREEEMYYQNALHRIRFYGGLSSYFYKYVFEIYRNTDYIEGQGQTIKHFTYENMKKILFPLPPLAEQKRIVEKIEELLPIVEKYGKAQDELNKLNEELPESLKKSVLQEAIEGRLVPQDPNDEPASILLERIRAEKERLVKEGKLKKKDLEVKPISEDEIPFEIPESWEWVRMSSLCLLITKGTTPRGGNVAYADKGIGFLRAENVSGIDRINTQNLKYIDKATNDGYLRRSILQENDLLITIAGTLGRTAIVRNEDLPLNANQAISLCRFVDVNKISLLFIVYALNAPDIQKMMLSYKKITAIPNLTLEIISDTLIPLPPLAEQKRIVEKIEQLLKEIDKLK